VPKHNNKCLSLCNTKHSLDTLWFLLQACRYLLEAVNTKDVITAKVLVKWANDNCTTDDDLHYTPLMLAAAKGHVPLVRVLLEGGASVETTNNDQWTALHYAAFHGHAPVCRLLLDRRARVDTVNISLETPLHVAARKGRWDVVILLVNKGANVRLKNKKRQTASDVALSEGFRPMANWLDKRM
jgi:ankyrin repeat protein